MKNTRPFRLRIVTSRHARTAVRDDTVEISRQPVSVYYAGLAVSAIIAIAAFVVMVATGAVVSLAAIAAMLYGVAAASAWTAYRLRRHSLRVITDVETVLTLPRSVVNRQCALAQATVKLLASPRPLLPLAERRVLEDELATAYLHDVRDGTPESHEAFIAAVQHVENRVDEIEQKAAHEFARPDVARGALAADRRRAEALLDGAR